MPYSTAAVRISIVMVTCVVYARSDLLKKKQSFYSFDRDFICTFQNVPFFAFLIRIQWITSFWWKDKLVVLKFATNDQRGLF